MSIRLDRRSFLLGSSALAAAGGFNLRPIVAQDAAMRLIFWGSNERAERTFGVVDAYTAQNAGVSIDGEFLAWGDYWVKLATQMAGGNAPDILQMDYGYIGEYARRGVLMPLDQFVPSLLDLSQFDDNTLAGGTVDGHLYAVSLGANASGMIINTTAWAEAGLETPDRGTTWQELAELGRAFTEARTDGVFGLEDASGYMPAFEAWLRQQGMAVYDAQGMPGFSAEDFATWLAMWQDMRGSGACVPAETQALYQTSIESTMLILGHSAISFAHSNQLVGFQALHTEPLAMLPYPVTGPDAEPGQFLKPSQFFSIYAESTYGEDAARFISYFVNDLEAASILGVERGVPESAAVREAITGDLDSASRLAVEYVGGLGDLSGPLPPPPPLGGGEFGDAVLRLSQEVGFGQRSSEDAGAALMAEAETILTHNG